MQSTIPKPLTLLQTRNNLAIPKELSTIEIIQNMSQTIRIESLCIYILVQLRRIYYKFIICLLQLDWTDTVEVVTVIVKFYALVKFS